MSSVPPFSQDPQSVRLTDREVMAMADLHRRMVDTRNVGPSLTDVAQMLGISEYEARALLAQVRKEAEPAQFAAVPVRVTHSNPSRRTLTAVLCGVALVAFMLMFFAVSVQGPRGTISPVQFSRTQVAEPSPATSETTTTPVPSKNEGG